MSFDFPGQHHANHPKSVDPVRFRLVYGLWDRPESTIAYLRGVGVG